MFTNKVHKMKLIVSLGLVFLFLFVGCQKDTRVAQKNQEKVLKGTITLSGAWALYPMVVKWAEEFQKIHPGVQIDVAAGGAGKGMADCLSEVVDLGMVSRDIYPAEIDKGAWWVSVTKDAVVATINENNPAAKALLERGIKRQTLIDIWINGTVTKWGLAAGTPHTDPIHVYTRSDACGAAKTWAQYFDRNQEDLLGVGVYGDPGLADAVKKDSLGIGFNNINFVYDNNTKGQVESIRVLPLDLNENGRLDKDEDFYRSLDELIRAIATDVYPSPPGRALHLVCHGKPQKPEVLEFIRWILTEGQAFISEAGYIELTEDKIQESLHKLTADIL
ncbi:MAG: PstS family phosphate ABC transporter substrate-binding protein [Sedimentisphaerales bacterium]|nr:PstS family phosphate ABC transporter substrate-binding protein [Sedimentisphaerales bacterium]